MKRAKITQEVIDRIAALSSEGKSNTEIAKILKISRVSVHRYAPKDAAKINAKDRIDEVKKLYSEGFRQSDIADQIGISKTTVQRILSGMPKPKSKILVPKKIKVEEPVLTSLQSSHHKEIKDYWLDGWTKTRIAKKLNISYNTVSKAIIAMGIEDDQPCTKLTAISPTEGRIKLVVDHRTTIYVRPENLEQTKVKWGIV